MAPDFKKIREARNEHARMLVEAFRTHASLTLSQHRQYIDKPHQSNDFLKAAPSRKEDLNIKKHLDELKCQFEISQERWMAVLNDKSQEAMKDLKVRLREIEIDWFKNSCIGDCIDAVYARWGSYGITAQGGMLTPVSEQISGMVASGATNADFSDLLDAVIHMPSCLGGDDYRYCCLLATGLRLRNQGLTSSMEEINSILHWFDRANFLMEKNNKISNELFSRLGA